MFYLVIKKIYSVEANRMMIKSNSFSPVEKYFKDFWISSRGTVCDISFEEFTTLFTNYKTCALIIPDIDIWVLFHGHNPIETNFYPQPSWPPSEKLQKPHLHTRSVIKCGTIFKISKPIKLIDILEVNIFSLHWYSPDIAMVVSLAREFVNFMKGRKLWSEHFMI